MPAGGFLTPSALSWGCMCTLHTHIRTHSMYSLVCTYTGNINRHVRVDRCSYSRLEQSAVSVSLLQYLAFTIQPQRNEKTCQEDVFPNTRQTPKTKIHLRDKTKPPNTRSKTPYSSSICTGVHTEMCRGAWDPARHCPSQEFLL